MKCLMMFRSIVAFNTMRSFPVRSSASSLQLRPVHISERTKYLRLFTSTLDCAFETLQGVHYPGDVVAGAIIGSAHGVTVKVYDARAGSASSSTIESNCAVGEIMGCKGLNRNEWVPLLAEETEKPLLQRAREITHERIREPYNISTTMRYLQLSDTLRITCKGSAPDRIHIMKDKLTVWLFSVKEGVKQPPSLVNIFKE